MRTTPRRIALVGLVCFFISLPAPSMEITRSQLAGTYNGLQANVFSMGLFSGAFGLDEYALIGLVGVINISFFLTPLILGLRISKKLLLTLLVFVFVGFASATYTLILFKANAFPFALASLHLELLYGYYLWIAGYLLQIAAIAYWLYHSVKMQTMNSSEIAP